MRLSFFLVLSILVSFFPLVPQTSFAQDHQASAGAECAEFGGLEASDSIELSWSALDYSALSYKLKRKKVEGGNGFQTIANLDGGFDGFVDTQLVAGQCYKYYVRKYYKKNNNGRRKNCNSKTIKLCAVIGNRPPVANPGEGFSAYVGNLVTLSAGLSTDPDGDSLEYNWSFVSVPEASLAQLSDPSLKNIEFQADKVGSYELLLVVSDGQLDSEPATITLQVTEAPSTLSNECLSVSYSTPTSGVNLSWVDIGSGAISYLVKRSTPGLGYQTVANLHSHQQSFTDNTIPGSCYKYYIRKRYRTGDGQGNGPVRKCNSLIIDTCAGGGDQNDAPVAELGEDLSSELGSTVLLDGSLSTDADGDPLSYQWTLVSSPAGSSAVISDPLIVKPTIVLDLPGSYTLSLVVNDGELDSQPAQITISTLNRAPVADAGGDQSGFLGDTITLDGSSSFDPDNDQLNYTWTLVSAPAGSTASLSGSDSVMPSFSLDLAGNYTISLLVNDGELDSPEDLVLVSTSNRNPTAVAGDDQEILLGQTASFDATASTDPDGDNLVYSWTISQAPDGSLAILVNPDTASPEFTPDSSGVYQLELVVNDGQENSGSDSLVLTVIKPNEAPSGVEASYTLDEDGQVSITVEGTDPDNNQLAFTVTVPPTSGTLTGTAPNLTYSPSENFNGSDSFQFTVNDGEFDSDPATIFFTVEPVNDPPVGENVRIEATEDEELEFSLQVSDPDQDNLTYAITAGPNSGTISGTAPDFTYTPDPNFSGTDSISFTVSDGTETVGPITITLSVLEVNDAPVAEEQSLSGRNQL